MKTKENPQKRQNAEQREIYKRNPEKFDHDNDGSRISREMAHHRRALFGKKYLAEMRNPDTIHPLSFEEFDSIPDIEKEKIANAKK
jgi:hypothetical protein